MRIDCVYFDKEEHLKFELGLNHNELWENGICLDDWDYGFIIKDLKEKDLPYWFEGIMREGNVCDVIWKELNLPSGNFLIGMSYHS